MPIRVKFQELERLAGEYMSVNNYTIGDFLVRIKNASSSGSKKVIVSENKLILAVSKKLEELGYISIFKKEKGLIEISIIYKNKEPLLTDIKLISKPGLRVYMSADKIAGFKSPWTYIISTPQGIKTNMEATKENLGGELIAKIL
jgi:small subunit ribosomal protein S8